MFAPWYLVQYDLRPVGIKHDLGGIAQMMFFYGQMTGADRNAFIVARAAADGVESKSQQQQFKAGEWQYQPCSGQGKSA